MGVMNIKDSRFELLVLGEQIQGVVEQTCGVIQSLGSNVVFVVMANGANWFSQRIFDRFPASVFDIEYALLKSYSGTTRNAITTLSMPDEENISGKTVVILEDFIDSGKTIEYMMDWCSRIAQAERVLVCPMCIREGVDSVRYNVANQPLVIAKDKWIVGCGLDYDHWGRNLADLYYMVR